MYFKTWPADYGGQQVAQLLLQSTLEFTALFIVLYSYISTSSKLHVTCAKFYGSSAVR